MNVDNHPGPSSRPSVISSAFALDDDPFDSLPITPDEYHPAATPVYDPEPFTYSNNPRARDSTTSLISSRRESTNSTLDGDTAHLTGNVHLKATKDEDDWRTDSEHNIADATPPSATRRRYSANLSPLHRSGTAIKKISEGIRRVSWRVANIAGSGLNDHIRLSGGDGHHPPVDHDAVDNSDEPFTDLGMALPLRGRTLGLFNPTSRVRRVMYHFLIFPCVLYLYLPLHFGCMSNIVAQVD